ncbi:hypothetical protein B566_EDAN016379 [Ephemera danica]|nr:hypothetical protein B566_EDAN016379 [Ephemera danica]
MVRVTSTRRHCMIAEILDEEVEPRWQGARLSPTMCAPEETQRVSLLLPCAGIAFALRRLNLLTDGTGWSFCAELSSSSTDSVSLGGSAASVMAEGLGRTRLDLVGVPDVEMDQRELGPSSVPVSSSERAASSSRGGRMVGNGLPSPLTPPQELTNKNNGVIYPEFVTERRGLGVDSWSYPSPARQTGAGVGGAVRAGCERPEQAMSLLKAGADIGPVLSLALPLWRSLALEDGTKTEDLTVDLSKATMATLVADLSRVREQLGVIAAQK